MNERQTDEGRERKITTDRETIRRWADERDAVPAYREEADERERHRFFPRGEVQEGYQERNWDTFFDDFESNDRAFVYHETDDENEAFDRHEIVARDEAAARATVANPDIEEQLAEGETVTTEVTETTVVEREIVETETIESEVTDSRPVRSRVTSAELLDWEVVDWDTDIHLESASDRTDTDIDVTSDVDATGYADVDLQTTVTGDVTAEVDERWRVERETEERLTVESRVVDVDVDEHDRVAEDTVETRVDTAGVERSIVESDLFDADANTETVDTDVIDTTAVEDSEALRFESHLVRRRRYEDEVRRRKHLRFDVTDVEVLDTETVESALLESTIAESDFDDESDVTATTTGTTTGTDADVATGTDADVATGTDADVATDTDADVATGGRTALSEDDEGKAVVDASGDEVGLVVDVEGDTLYVDANPGFFERLEAALGWESRDEDSYPIAADQIAKIDDRRVVLEHEGEAGVDDR